MAFASVDRTYMLITDAAIGTTDSLGSLGAILIHVDEFRNH